MTTCDDTPEAACSSLRPEVIESIRAIARRNGMERVTLFGSRARGDYTRASDIDLAVSGGQFAAFALDVDEETPTLLKYNFVNMDAEVQPQLREKINRDGKTLYEATKRV